MPDIGYSAFMQSLILAEMMHRSLDWCNICLLALTSKRKNMFLLFFLQSNKYYGVGELSLRIMSETASTEVSHDLPIWNLIITF